MTPLVPGSPRPCLSLVVVLGRCNRQGPIKNCHPRAIQYATMVKFMLRILEKNHGGSETGSGHGSETS
jgi:hypothetical protein